MAHTRRTFVPCVRVTSVLPTFRLENMLGALTSYQSFFENGSTLQPATGHVRPFTLQQIAGQCQRAICGLCYIKRRQAAGPHVFFFPPFFPLEIRLFLPTAIVGKHRDCWSPAHYSSSVLCLQQHLCLMLLSCPSNFAATTALQKASTAPRCRNLCSATSYSCTNLG